MKITDANERASKGYDDKKEFTCVCCGKKVLLTKFASAKTAKCQECKSTGKQINPELIPTQAVKTKSEIYGNTKILPCTKCGTMVEVSKFMSAAKVLCEHCKNDEYRPSKINVDISKIDRDTMPTIEDYNVLPSNIANKRLRDVVCPACGEHHMRIINIMDYSAFGLVIEYQCNKCKLLVNVSEQCKFRCKTRKIGRLYDYSGHEIEDMVDGIESTRLYGTINRLYDIIKEHDIKLEGIELPPYLYAEDKPVPIGFVIPSGDRDIKAVQDTIQLLKDLQHDLGEADMHQNDISNCIVALQKLFTVEGNGNGREN